MHILKQLLAFGATLLIGHVSTQAQGVFTSPSLLLSPDHVQKEEMDSASQNKSRTFPITYLDKTPITTLSKASSNSPLLDPVKDSLQFLRYVDSLAFVRVNTVRFKESNSKKVSSERDRSLNRLRDVPSILPFFVSSATASKVTGQIKARMSSGFGLRQHPILGNLVSHPGIDLPAALGTLVYATADGYCRQIINQKNGIGLAIYLSHGRGHQTLYGHLLTTGIKPGDFVLRGQVIGRVGASGMTTGPHLHYGVRYNGQVVDPLPYCFLLSKPVKPIPSITRQ